MEPARLLTEGYDGEISGVLEENAWPRVRSLAKSRRVVQVEAKGVRNYTLYEKKIPCLQVQVGNVVGIVPAHETGVRGVPESIDELNNLTSKEKISVMRRIERVLVGLPVWIIIYALDSENKTFMASRKKALEVMAPQAWKRIKESVVLPATVRELYPKRAVLDLGGVEAVMFAHEMSWGYTDDVRDVLERGKTYEVKVIKADRETGRVEVSLKQTLPSPWPDCARRYEKGGIYCGTVAGITDSGVIVSLEPGVDVFTHHPKFSPVRKGDKVNVYLVKVDAEKQRIYGRLRG